MYGPKEQNISIEQSIILNKHKKCLVCSLLSINTFDGSTIEKNVRTYKQRNSTLRVRAKRGIPYNIYNRHNMMLWISMDF